jgi:hypothetical protein
MRVRSFDKFLFTGPSLHNELRLSFFGSRAHLNVSLPDHIRKIMWPTSAFLDKHCGQDGLACLSIHIINDLRVLNIYQKSPNRSPAPPKSSSTGSSFFGSGFFYSFLGSFFSYLAGAFSALPAAGAAPPPTDPTFPKPLLMS